MSTTLAPIAAVTLAACLVLLATALSLSMPPRAPRDHLCPIAEISPDITPAERQRCRQLRTIKP